MDTDKLNRWMTLIANVGVVTGLVFLAIEVRQNTESLEETRKQVKLLSYQTSIQNLDESYRTLANSPYMAEIFVKYDREGPDALSHIEMQRFKWQSYTGMSRLNTMHYLNEIGYGNQEDYNAVFPVVACEHAARWNAIGIWPDRPAFRAAIEDLVANRCD